MHDKALLSLMGISEAKINKLKSLKPLTLKILDKINSHWPTNPLEVARELDENGKTKSLSSRYLYHFRKLHAAGLIQLKRTGNTYIAWPIDMEKLRVLHEMIREED